nr:hypothetical protein GCM10020093_088130 [Planobispora longispora]
MIFADEPTGALDSLAGEQVMDALVGTARESRTALVVVTHDNRVAAYADREIVLRDGAVAGTSTAGASTAGASVAGPSAADGEVTA